MVTDALPLLVVPDDRPGHLHHQLDAGQRLAERVAQVALGHPGLKLAAPDGGHHDQPRTQQPLNSVPERPLVIALGVIQPHQRRPKISNRELTQPC